jgi:hypothetical protein
VQGRTFRFHLLCKKKAMHEWIIHYMEVNATKVS